MRSTRSLGLPHRSSHLRAQPEAVPRPPKGREDRDPLHPRPRPDADGGLGFVRQRDVLVAREGIGEHPELEARLDEGLEPEPRRALAPVAEADDDPVALREVPVAAHVERDPPGTRVAAVLAAHGEGDPGRGLHGGEPGARGIVALDHRLVGLHAKRDLEAPPVVDAELPAGVGEGEALPAPGLEAAGGLDGRRPHEVGAVVVIGHGTETLLAVDALAPAWGNRTLARAARQSTFGSSLRGGIRTRRGSQRPCPHDGRQRPPVATGAGRSRGAALRRRGRPTSG